MGSRRLASLAALALLAGCAAVADPLEQSLLYRHRPVSAERYKAIVAREAGVEEVRLPMSDGTVLHGLLKRAAEPAPGGRAPLVIFFGGVARETSWMAGWGDKPPAWGWLMVNYRGYGLSEGRPSHDALVADAREIFDWAAARPDVDADRIVVLGRSLGSFVAVSLAAQRPVRAAILATPFDSLAALADRRYPLLPTNLLLGGRYDSAALAPAIRVPALFVIAENDDVTPPAHGEALARAWGGPSVVIRLPGGHRMPEWRPEYWSAVGEFLAPLQRRGGTVQK